MSLFPSAPGVLASRKIMPIRPAVPLVYERRVSPATARTPSCNSRSRNAIEQFIKDDDDSNQDSCSVQKSAAELGNKLADERGSELQYGSKETVERHTAGLSHDAQEMEPTTEVFDVLPGEYREKTREEGKEKAETESASKDFDHESPTVSMDPPSSIVSSPIESISQANGTIHPPESHPGAFPDHTGKIAHQQTFPPGWIVPPYDLQAQAQFTHGWIRGHGMNGIGGLPPPTPSMSVDDGNVPIDPKFVDHISSSFNDDRYADVRLIVSHEKAQFDVATFCLHRVLVCRSETLKSLIEMSTRKHDGIDKKLDLRISLCDRFITQNALESALRTCYGQTASASLLSKCQDMQEILAFAAAGHLLKLEEVALQALEKTRKILNWVGDAQILRNCFHHSVHPSYINIQMSHQLQRSNINNCDQRMKKVQSHHSLYLFSSKPACF